MEPDRYDKLIGALYEAAFDPALWEAGLRNLAHACDADNFHLMVCPVGQSVPSFSLTWGMDPALEASYKLYYAGIDPRQKIVQRSGDGRWLACHQQFDTRMVGRNEFYQDFLIPNDIRYLLGARIVRCDGIDVLYGMHRAPGRPPFEGEPVALMKQLTGHFQRASRLWLRTEGLREQAARGALALDLVENGVIALDHTGRVKHANRFAEALLREARELRVRNGKLCTTQLASAMPFAEAMKACAADRRPRSWRIGRLNLTLVPLASSGPLADALNAARFVLLIGAETRMRKATMEQLMQAFGFTAAEARVAQAIAAGDTLSDHAVAQAVSLNTVKTHLKAVFAKTACRRQSDLARLLAAVPPNRGDSSDSRSESD